MERLLLCCIVVVITGWNIQTSESCSCAPVHPQDIFCHSDFSIKAKVLGIKILPVKGFHGKDPGLTHHEKVYTVYVKEVYRAHHCSLKPGTTIQISTPFSSAMCGATLTYSKTHLLTGKYKNKRFMIDSCGFNSLWWSLSPHQRNSVRNRYPKFCHCKIGKGNCKLPHSYEEMLCYYRYATCVEKGYHCQWKTGIGLKTKCLNEYNICYS